MCSSDLGVRDKHIRLESDVQRSRDITTTGDTVWKFDLSSEQIESLKTYHAEEFAELEEDEE